MSAADLSVLQRPNDRLVISPMTTVNFPRLKPVSANSGCKKCG